MSGGSGELFPLEAALRGLRERFGEAVLDADRTSLRERTVVVPAGRLAEVASAVSREWGGQLVTLFALDERAAHGRYRLHALFSMAPEDAVLTLIAAVPELAPIYPSVAARVPAAAWLEREIRDLMGVVPAGHPDPRPLVAHAGWPAGAAPLRKDFAPSAAWSWAPRFEVPRIEGDGVFEIPVGPIHAGVIEPGHFRFQSVGESVLALDIRLGWTWRGLEKLAEGAPWTRGLELAERVCGTCAFSHALAFSQAVEEIAGVTVPPRARALRSLAAELERLANHLLDASGILSDVAWVTGGAEFARLREIVQRACDTLFGHRLLRGVCVPGGVRLDLDDAQQLWLRSALAGIRGDVPRALESAFANAAVTDRLATGTLEAAAARDLGATGPTARASGIARDARRDHPYAFYRELDFRVPGRAAGDVRARLELRADEVDESLNLIEQLVLRLPGGPLAQHLGTLPAGRWGLGLVESPRGLLSHWLRVGPDGAIGEWRVRSASHANWPAVAQAATTAVVPDFPLVNKSFNLCIACVDR